MNIDFIINKLDENAQKEAVISNGKAYTFKDIKQEFLYCNKLLANNNIQPYSVISLLAEFKPRSVAMFLSLIQLGCIIVPISKTIKKIDEYLRVSQTEVFIDLSNDEPVFIKTNQVVNHTMLLNLKSKNTAGLILFSSGTTGEPKAALHDLSLLVEKFKKPGKTLRTITFLLFDHIGGFNTMMHTLANGGMIATIEERSPDAVCSVIENNKIELLPTTPTFLNIMLLNKTYEKYDLSSLKVISYGTEPMPQSTLILLSKVFPNVKLKQTYGLSEVGIMATKSEKSDSLWLKLGGEGFETKIENDILYIRAKSAMIGYLNADSPFDKEGWFNTKDKVEVKGDYIKILGRVTDLINVGGEKVYPIEIESVLLTFKGVLDARVTGVPNLLIGNTIEAVLKVAPENNNKEFVKSLRVFCFKNLERFKIPTKITLTENDLYGDRLKKKR